MMLDISSFSYWSFIYLFLRNVSSDLLPLFIIELYEFFIYSRHKYFVQHMTQSVIISSVNFCPLQLERKLPKRRETMCVFPPLISSTYEMQNKYEGMNGHTITCTVVLTTSSYHLGKAAQ